MKVMLLCGLAVLCVFSADAGRAYAQSPIFDSLNRAGSGNGDLEQLRIANQMAENHANSVAKRADLLSRRVNEMYKQNTELRNQLEQLDQQFKKMKAELSLAQGQCGKLSEQLEKKDLTGATEQLAALEQSIVASLGSLASDSQATADRRLIVMLPDEGFAPAPGNTRIGRAKRSAR